MSDFTICSVHYIYLQVTNWVWCTTPEITTPFLWVEGLDKTLILCLLLVACKRGSDIVLALDSSGSIGLQNVQDMVGFLELLINALNVDDANDADLSASRIGMLTYSDRAVVEFYLNTYRKRTEILPAINVRYRGGTTNTHDAIRYSSWFKRRK